MTSAPKQTEQELAPFEIILAAGDARSRAFDALAHAKQGDFEGADQLMDESRAAALKAHEMQTSLLARAAGGEPVEVDVMLVHAQDHLMCGMLASELITELIELYRTR